MDTLPTPLLLCYIIFLVIAHIGVAFSIVYTLRLPHPKGTRKQKHQGGQREESAREEKAESRPVLKSSSEGGIHKRDVSSGEKPLKPGPAEVRIQVQPKNTAPVKSLKPTVALKDGSVKHTASLGPPQPQAAFTVSKSGGKPLLKPSAGNTGGGERKRINPITFATSIKAGKPIQPGEFLKQDQEEDPTAIRPLKRKGPLKAYSTDKHDSITDIPQEQSAITNTTGEKNDPTRIGEPAQMGNESEAGMGTTPGTEVNQADSEPPAATEDSGETDQGKPQKEKSSLGDLADLFAVSASEFTEKNKLSEQVNDIDVNEILQEGLGLLDKVKKSDV